MSRISKIVEAIGSAPWRMLSIIGECHARNQNAAAAFAP
jgi:hypothetical protein